VYALAHDLDLPVQIHIVGLGGGAQFPIELGNPLRLNPVLGRYPGLRIYIENIGWPFLDEATALMFKNPTVYADISTVLHLFPRQVAWNYLESAIENGLGKRIMFGSDQMSWPEVIPETIEVIQQAPFLTREQKADILYNNAARFFQLSSEDVARHREAWTGLPPAV
jgi:predicted TIM-barrel fold metal-dependent hydrolase